MTKQEIRRVINDIAPFYSLSPTLVEAVVITESSYKVNAYRYEPAFWRRYLAHKPFYQHKDPKVVSASYGLMQLMYPTAREEFGFKGKPEDLYDPITNIHYGCSLLAKNLKWAKGNMDAALAAYNGGRTKNNLKPPYRNQVYVDKVRKHERGLVSDV